jgi:uncharacterized repeat protein (TIGR01451 family)
MAGCKSTEKKPVSTTTTAPPTAPTTAPVATSPNVLVLPVGEGAGALRLVAKGEPTVGVGETYQYTVVVSNESNYVLQDVTLRQTTTPGLETYQAMMDGRELGPLTEGRAVAAEGIAAKAGRGRPARFIPAQATPPPPSPAPPQAADSLSAHQYAWQVGTLQPHESKTIVISGVAQEDGTVRSCLAVDYRPMLCAAVQVVKPALELERVFLQEGKPTRQFYSCDEIVATYRLTNTGTGPTQRGMIVEQLPQGLATAEGTTTVEIPFEPLAAGQTVTKKVVLKAAQHVEYQGRALAKTGKLETHSGVEPLVAMHPRLEVTIDGPAQSYMGRVLQYDIVVRNVSEDPAVKTTLALGVPQERVERFSISTGEAAAPGAKERTYDLGRLEPGEARRVTVSFEATAPGPIQVAARVQAYCVDVLEKTAQTTITGIPALRLEVIDRVDPVPVGGTTTYEIQVKNQGSADAVDIQVRAELPENMTFVEGKGPSAVQQEGQTLVFGPVARIPPGEVVSWTVQARGEKAGLARFRLSLTSAQIRTPILEIEPTTVY